MKIQQLIVLGTAFASAMADSSQDAMVYHQNWGKKVVRQDRMQLADLKKGWLRIYRPVAQR